MTAQHSSQDGLFDRFRVVQRRTVGQAADVYLAQERGASTGVEIWWVQARALAAAGSAPIQASLTKALDFQHPQTLPLREASLLAGRVAAIYAAPNGIPLSRLVRSTGPLAPDRAVAIIRSALGPVQAAIEQGIVHPGLSPENVYIDRSDQVMVGQFGLPLLPLLPDANQPVVQCVGPEQVVGQSATAAAQVYSAAALLYWLIAGVAPFGDDPEVAADQRSRFVTAPDITAMRPRTPLWIAVALNQALSMKSELRPATPAEFIVTLSPSFGISTPPAEPGLPISSEFKLATPRGATVSRPEILLPSEPAAERGPAFTLTPVDRRAAQKLRKSQRPYRRGSTRGRRAFLYATAFAAFMLAAVLFSGPADAGVSRAPEAAPVLQAIPTPTNTPEPTATLNPNRPNVTCAYPSPRGSAASGTNFVQLRGIVRDRTGKPISGALVQINGASVVQMTTGAAGTYVFDALDKGVFHVQISGPTLKSVAYRIDASATGPAQLYLLDWTEGACN